MGHQLVWRLRNRCVYSLSLHHFDSLRVFQLAQYLDEFVIGQESAKKVLSVAYVTHFTFQRGGLLTFLLIQSV